MATKLGVKPGPDTIAVVVARGRSVRTPDGTHGAGKSLALAPNEAAFLVEQGFVTLAGQETTEPRTIRVQDAAPDGIGMQTGARPSWEEDLASSRRGVP